MKNSELSYEPYDSALVLPFSIVDPSNIKSSENKPPNVKYYITGGLYEKTGKKIECSERIGGIGGDHALSINPTHAEQFLSTKYPIIRGRSLYLGHWMGHYGHFITEFLSRLWCVDELSEIDQIVVLPFLFDGKKVVIKPWHKALLLKLGLSHLEIVPLYKPCILEKVFVPEQGWIVNHTVNSRTRRVYDKIALSNTNSSHRGLYFLSRKQKSYKRLTNLAEIEALFRKHNFTVVYPEKLSMNRQLDIYADAACLASASGTGLHNSVFARASTLIIELGDTRNRQKGLSMQKGATELLNQQHYFIPYRGADIGNADIDLLEVELKSVLAQAEYY